ncbi:ABC transporter substrate-binding protein [Bordetella genomosp. 10]|nr:ABC transporter substrate-binding protein [Bordetella genomosp. 10]
MKNRLARYALGMVLGISAVPAHALDEVTVGLTLPPTPANGSLWDFAQQLGIWQEEGIQVKTIVFNGAGAVIPQVAAKSIFTGLPSPESILQAFAAGQDLPLVYVYNQIPVNTLEFAVLEDSPIHRVEDLKNGKIGVGALTWGNIPSTRAVLKDAGIKRDEYEIIPVGALNAGFTALKRGKVDALNFNRDWNDMFELSGNPIRHIPLPGVYGAMSLNGFVVHPDTLKSRPDLIVRFGRAYSKARIACAANVPACVAAYWRAHPEARPAEADVRAGKDHSLELTRRWLARFLTYPDGTPRVQGEFDISVIRQYVHQMAVNGEFASDKVPVDRLFTNAFVKQFNQFDAEAIRARARGVTP